ncbi:uncharacterized protein LOC128993503 [Macrosteles quadrilineatus]|uniref:uncharacterized protein LOC128993503 n=1 Tax=Macrosteles quadrilineatus TaxID=74068 RepID=UPI0023E112B8|nr:uncharacterized protein LOC128993503 [Macrosteles quadrilineatus]
MGEKEGIISRRGLVKKHAALDYEVWKWKTRLEEQNGSQRVTKNEVQAYALESYKLAGIEKFKASDGWYRRWRQRWKSSDTNINNDKTPIEVDEENETASTSTGDKVAIQKFPKKRQCPETNKQKTFKLMKIEENNKNNRITEKLIKNPQYSFVLPDDTTSCQSEKEETQVADAKINNLISDESNPDTFILNMNFVKVQKPKISKELNCNPLSPNSSTFSNPNTVTSEQTLPTNSCEKDELSGAENCIGGPTTLDFDKVIVVSAGEQVRTNLNQDEHVYVNGVEKTVEVIENDEVENLWTFVNQYQVGTSLIDDNPGCSQADSGISVPSRETVETTSDLLILSSIFEHDEINFSENDHELFCDSCEDFHPRQKSPHVDCKKKKEMRNNFLLSCALEKKESVSVASLSCVNIKRGSFSTNSRINTGSSQLSNPSVVAPKGKRYLQQFKNQVVNYALKHSVKLAGEKFKVNRNTIAEWLAEHSRYSAEVKHVNQVVASDSEFLAWLEGSKFNLTNELVKQKALEYLHTVDHTNCRQSRWLWMYAHRLNGMESVGVKKRYIVYPEAFKRAVVFHAQTHSNMAAARVFGVARKRVIEWQQNLNVEMKSDVTKSSKSTNAYNVTDGTVDQQVYEWFCKQEITPTSREVRNKAVELYRVAGHQGIQCGANWYYRWRARHNLPASRDQFCASVTPLLIWTLSQLDNNKFVSQSALAAQAASLGLKKMSRGWTFRFCKKYSALLQALPAPETPLPVELEQLVSEYKQKLHDLISRQQLSEDCIIALDEIPLHLLPKDKAKKPLLIRRPGFESCQATLMISCLANGTLLPTLIVLKGSGPGPNNVSDPRVVAFVNDTGQVTDTVVQEWLSSVCNKNLPGAGVVILDSFDKHMTPSVTESAASHNVHLAITPPGCAFRLLPITHLCHTFKVMLEEMCQVWLSSQTATLESPSPDQLYLWAVRVHRHIAKHYQDKMLNEFKSVLLHESSQSTCN